MEQELKLKQEAIALMEASELEKAEEIARFQQEVESRDKTHNHVIEHESRGNIQGTRGRREFSNEEERAGRNGRTSGTGGGRKSYQGGRGTREGNGTSKDPNGQG